MGAWDTLAGKLFSARFGHATFAYNGKLYVVGGCTAQSSSSCTTAGVLADVRYSTLDVNVGASWTSTTSLPNGRVWHRAEVYSGRVYIIGGINTAPALATNGYYSSVIDGSGNIASFTANLGPSRTRYDFASVAYNGYMYVVGGCFSYPQTTCAGSYTGQVEYAVINSNGTLGSWTISANAGPARLGLAMVAFNDALYVSGGSDGTSNKITSAVALVNGVPTSAWSELNTTEGSLFGTFHHGFVVSGSYAYIVGGNTSSISSKTGSSYKLYLGGSGANKKSRYERYIDYGINYAPYSIVINGTSCAGYTVEYKGASNSTKYFGTLNTISNVTPGSSQTFSIPGSRYLFLAITMDDSSCTNTTSTITDITVTFKGLPVAPTLFQPISGATNTSLTPEFRLASPNAFGDYHQYKIEILDASCTSVVRTVDQTASQTGWLGQSEQSSTG
jgi:hypothetical protein